MYNYTSIFAFRTHAFAWDDSVVFSSKVTNMVREGMHKFLIWYHRSFYFNYVIKELCSFFVYVKNWFSFVFVVSVSLNCYRSCSEYYAVVMVFQSTWELKQYLENKNKLHLKPNLAYNVAKPLSFEDKVRKGLDNWRLITLILFTFTGLPLIFLISCWKLGYA